MTAADAAREHLTAVIWEVLRAYSAAPLVHHAGMIHSAAEAYGHAIAQDIAADGTAAGPRRLAAATAEYYGRQP